MDFWPTAEAEFAGIDLLCRIGASGQGRNSGPVRRRFKRHLCNEIFASLQYDQALLAIADGMFEVAYLVDRDSSYIACCRFPGEPEGYE